MLFVAYPSEKATRKDEIDWIIDRTRRNISKGTQTCIISAYSALVKSDLSGVFDNELVIYADIVHDAVSGSRSERIFEIDDELLDISIFLSHLIENAKKVRIPLDIIFHNFSAVIHNLGNEETYKLITYKTPKLSEDASLILFIFPKNHTEEVWERFKSQAREVIEV